MGANDLPNYSPDEVSNMIRNLAIKVRNNNINCHVSSLIMRVDKPDLNEKMEMVNSKLRDMLESENINLITHGNISGSHLNWGGLHLNKRRDAALASTLLKLYAMFHNVFSNNNANLRNCREINVDDIRKGSSRSLHDREQCQYLKIHSLNIFYMMTHFD